MIYLFFYDKEQNPKVLKIFLYFCWKLILMKTIKTALVLLLVIFFISCEDDGIFGLYDEQSNTDFELNFGYSVNHNFIGKVIDVNYNPINDAEVKIGDQTATTDANGIFLINEASVYQNFAYITARKSGFLQGSTSMIPNSGTNKLTIMLLDNTPIRTIDSGVVETISLTDGTSITLQGDYVNDSGSSYSGIVDVFLYNISPSDKKIENLITGMPYAEGEDGKENYLENFGMIAIELRDSSGNILNLADDSSAEIRVPLEATLQTIAPNAISLWYFDTENGYWKEGEEANLQGQAYVGTIDRLSFWSLSKRYPVHIIKVKVSDNDDNAISNQQINLTYGNSNYPFTSINDYTNSEGLTRLLAPSETINLSVYNHDICGGNIIHNEVLVSTTIDLETAIILSDSNLSNEQIVGSFTTCSDAVVELGYVSFEIGTEMFYDPIYQGEYKMNFLSCTSSKSFQISAIDYLNTQEFGTINYYFVNPITYIGELAVCNNVREIIQFTIDEGTEKVLITNKIYAKFNPTNSGYNAPSLTIFEQTTNSRFNLFGLLNTPPYTGVYDNYEIGNHTDRGMNIGQSIDVSNTNNNISYNFVKLGNIGEYIDMHFNGEYEDMNGNPHNIVGVVHIIRDK